MNNGQRIVLKELETTQYEPTRFKLGYQFYNPLRNDVFNQEIVCTPSSPVDEHWLIWKGKRMWNGGVELINVIGVTSDNVEQRTYNLAKKLAEQRAENEVYGWHNDKRGIPLVDETSRAKESALVVA